MDKEQRISDLKKLLFLSDFKIIKCYEAQLLDIEMPYDFKELIKQREEWREELRKLEELSTLND
jgi:hypothetical protein